jgi:glycosyltransferase involved in cell wall biosynthesis
MSKIGPIRIGVDFHTWDGIFQGSRSHVLGVYREAIRQAPDITFVFFLHGIESLRDAYPEFRAKNVELVKVRHMPGLARLVFQLSWLQVAHKIDILHTQYRIPLIPLGKTACTIHDVLFETHPQYFSKSFVLQSQITFRMAAKFANALFSVSHFSKSELARLYGVAPERVEVTYNGVDTRRFHPAPGGEDLVQGLGLVPGQYMLTVGRLEPRKNQAALIRAWNGLGPSAPPLVIVGQRDFSFGDVFAALEEVEDKSRVILLDRVSDEALPAVIRHAALFVYPAFAEGFGMPVAEAMASGVPVVTSNTTSLPEVAGAGAVLVDPTSVQSIQSGMARALANEGVRQDLVRAALVHVAQFDWAASASVLVQRFRAMMANDRPV